MEKVKREFVKLFKQGKYVTNTTYYKNNIKNKNKIGVGNITHENVDEGLSIFMTHSGENNHSEKTCFHFNNSDVSKIHTSDLTNASSYGNKLYLSKNKKIVSLGKGFSHIKNSYIEYKKVASKDDNDIVIKSYIKKNNKYSLQSVTRLIPS